ncbi:hypothetical protein TNCV_183681 [Trichonephila clavipes]|nr:hypothetical protein TNCV_183681 [Trichonephila clavipes]
MFFEERILLIGLMGALLAALLEGSQNLESEVFSQSLFWTDSQVTALDQGQAIRWKPFVANRVRKIQPLTDLTRGSSSGKTADPPRKESSVDALTANSSGGMDPRFYVETDFRPKDR